MKNFVDKIQQFYFFQVIFQRIRKVIINVIVFAFIFVVQFGPIVFVAKNDFSNFSLEFKNRRIFFWHLHKLENSNVVFEISNIMLKARNTIV